MSKDSGYFIRPVLEQLGQVIASLNKPDSLDGLIAAHFDTHRRLQKTFAWHEANTPTSWIAEQGDASSQAPKLAILGALLAAQNERFGQLDLSAAKIFDLGLQGLQNRKADFFSSTSWVLQPNIVLAIALGIRAISNVEAKAWFTELVSSGLENKTVPLLPRLMYGYVLHIFEAKHPGISISNALASLETCSLPELALGMWLAQHEIGDWETVDRLEWLEHIKSYFWERVVLDEPYETEDYKAALLWIVIMSYLNNLSLIDSSQQVSNMLENFPAALERWKKDWKIVDEIDIQRLVYLILRTYFEDLTYEDNLPKLGRSGHRYDIGIPQFKLLVEIKFARKSSDFQKFIEEVGKDVAQIHTQTMFTSFIVFIYDTTCSTQNYAWTRQAILQFSPVKDVVIVCAPSTAR